MEDKGYTDIINRYLEGEMSSAEKESFLEQVKSNAALKDELELAQDIQKGIELHGSRRLKYLLQAEEKKYQNKPAKSWGWKVAASFFILVGLGYVIFNFANRGSSDIYSQYYLPYPNIVSPVNRSDEGVRSDALADYEQENYQKAIEKLAKQLQSDPQNDVLNFYIGQSLLATGDADQAIPYFKNIGPASRFYDPAAWYYGLSLLKTRQMDEAKAQFEQIAGSGSSYADEAAEIAGKL
ncbi:hypothetical protein GCM10009122_13790 [Fulvivirga kasyanovii]|uniref:Tetratricopeptide repeat protein n=1 Tax=Fulvivirga kasyanovii TaxID=396812 RepID=A0ABW9RUL5_9BACT|nr:tetratricopeptide repeat protein [Fulvivirga kasyanovii]MTI27401.1 hypothetical protein [Fulvivirga kasyanovii]